MIPLKLSLQQFLSYGQANLDFRQLHTACICGENGAGKSAILEGLTWGIWGQSRVGSEDNLIRQGATEAFVEVVYQSFGQTYRILRSRALGGQGTLEWQIQTEQRWRSLTQKGIRTTQQAIQKQLRLDYNTFINSAYLRQGRADEFTLKRPGDRKRLLAEMLQLEQYDRLAEQCRERVRAAKVEVDFFQQQYRQQQEQLERRQEVHEEHERLNQQQQQLTEAQTRDRQLLEETIAREQQLQQAQQQVQLLQEKIGTVRTSLQHTEIQWRQQQERHRQIQELVSQAVAIERGNGQYREVVAQVELLQQQFQSRQSLLQTQQELQQNLSRLEHQHSLSLQRYRAQLDQLHKSETADGELVADGQRITGALTYYRQAQATLTRLDRIQTQATPLLEQIGTSQRQIEQERERLLARKENLQQQLERLQYGIQYQQVEQAVVEVEGELKELSKQRVYQQRVLEKCQERRSFVEKLQERQRALQREWQTLEDRCHQLLMPGQSCPLCTQVLQGDLRSTVLEKQRTQQDGLSEQLWVIREQLAVTDREIGLLHTEYEELSETLATFDERLQVQGRLHQQLESSQLQVEQINAWQEELRTIDRDLEEETYALAARERLAAAEQDLAQLNYNDKDHALCRSEVDRWRWAAFKQSELRKAKQRLERNQRTIQELETQIAQLSSSTNPTQQEIQQLNGKLETVSEQLKAIAYDECFHNQLRQQLKTLMTWKAQAEALQDSRQQLPQCTIRCQQLKALLQKHRQSFTQCQRQLDVAQNTLKILGDSAPDSGQATAEQLRQTINKRRRLLDRILPQLGATQQQLIQFDALEKKQSETQENLQQARRQLQVYRELAVAYGCNGIPALVIENVLPELEAEANQLLSRLTNNQLHLQFVTQRSGRSSNKTIDTLDILIADPRGTRPYETYSGGEAFRINFAIRLALSRLLAQRSGASLQTLLIDEGFGTQDTAGRESLVAAINAVASDFACILTITHIPSLRDRFPTRVQVTRTAEGSELEILN